MSIVGKIEDIELVIAELKKLVVGTETQAGAECYEEPWYHSIPPEGIDCYVSDWCNTPGTKDSNGLRSGVPRKVLGYIEGDGYCFKVDSITGKPESWIYAKPVREL